MVRKFFTTGESVMERDAAQNETLEILGGDLHLQDSYEKIKKTVEESVASGGHPILYRVEWYQAFGEDLSRLDELFSLGCRFAVCRDSLLGKKGLRFKWVAWYLVRKGMVEVILAA